MTISQQDSGRRVRTANWNLHYHEAGSGYPVIMLHGSGVGASGWSNFSGNLEALAAHYRVLAVDMPGWGASDPCPVDKLDHVAALMEFMDALGIEKAAMIGNSMGGTTVLRTAVEHPDRISHLITMGAPANRMPRLFGAGDGPTEGIKILIEGYRNPTPETIRRLVQIMCFDKAFATDELCIRRAEAANACPEHLANFLAGLARGWPVPKWAPIEDLMKLKIPALLIHGRDDRVLHWENSMLLNAYIPNSRLVLLNRCGHWAMIEHAAEFNRLVVDFVQHA